MLSDSFDQFRKFFEKYLENSKLLVKMCQSKLNGQMKCSLTGRAEFDWLNLI